MNNLHNRLSRAEGRIGFHLPSQNTLDGFVAADQAFERGATEHHFREGTMTRLAEWRAWRARLAGGG